jgi:putative DNA primase/helicase
MTATITFMLKEALDYAAHGWPVLPMWWPYDGRCSCDKIACNPAKHPIGPLAPNGVHDATTDEETIMRWFRRFPHCNVGVATGKASGLIVLDVDPRNRGDETLGRVLAEFGSLPETPTVITGGGGQHVYLAYDGRPSIKAFMPGLDLLSDGAIAMAPYSEHVSGGRYRWVTRPW